MNVAHWFAHWFVTICWDLYRLNVNIARNLKDQDSEAKARQQLEVVRHQTLAAKRDRSSQSIIDSALSCMSLESVQV